MTLALRRGDGSIGKVRKDSWLSPWWEMTVVQASGWEKGKGRTCASMLPALWVDGGKWLLALSLLSSRFPLLGTCAWLHKKEILRHDSASKLPVGAF